MKNLFFKVFFLYCYFFFNVCYFFPSCQKFAKVSVLWGVGEPHFLSSNCEKEKQEKWTIEEDVKGFVTSLSHTSEGDDCHRSKTVPSFDAGVDNFHLQ